MPEIDPQSPSPTPAAPKPAKTTKVPEEPLDRAHMPMSEEFDKAKWTLPPWQPVAVALVIVAAILAVVAWTARAKPPGAGKIDNVTAVEIPPGGSVLVAVTLTLSNSTPKQLWIHDLKAQLKTDQGEWSDNAAAEVDTQRYFQAFPDLKQNALNLMKVDDKILPGGQERGTLVFSFPVTKDQFDARKSLSVTVQPYDQPRPVVLK